MAEETRIPSHPPTPQGYGTIAPQRHILMTPHMAAIGGLLAFFTVVLMVVVLPTETYTPPASDNWLPLSNAQWDGRAIFVGNGCVYCHSGFTRPQDTFNGLYYLYPRTSEAGDYYGVNQSPNLLGSERTGPDLSQEGGNHPDQWQFAHYQNPRNTTPLSIMPQFSFLSQKDITNLIAFNQSQGGKEATLRFAAQTVAAKLGHISDGSLDPAKAFPNLVQQVQASGQYKADGKPDDMSPWGLAWGDVFDLNTFERSYWLTQDPLPPTQQNLNAGRQVFVQRCVGCHGAKGLGDGPAAQYLDPKPDDFSDKGMFTSPTDGDGERYFRIIKGGKGTAMENFATRLTLEDTWRVILFLRTIPNGGFDQPITTVDKYQAWSAPQGLLTYIQAHPINAPGLQPSVQTDPFMSAAHWIFSGMAPGDTIMVGGKLSVTLDTVASLVRDTYFQMVNQDYQDAQGRHEKLPPKDQVLSMDGVQWHDP